MNQHTYSRPPLAWIKRRARRLMRFYGVSRRLAVFDALTDYVGFVGDLQRSQG